MEREYRELSTMYYQASKPVGFSIDGDIEYYRKALQDVSGLVLEAGVGTGRLLIPLIHSGIRMEGLDSSPEMLKQCRLNLEKHKIEAVLYEQNLMDLSLPKSYGTIIMPAGTFCLLDSDNAQEVLQRLYNHLDVAGRLIIDIEMPMDFQEGTVTTTTVSTPDNQEIRLTSHSEKMDWLAQRVTYINKYDLVYAGEVIKTETSILNLNWYGIEEFRMRLSLAGFKDISYQIAYGKDEVGIVTFVACK